jgi:hypothetical protein
VTVLGSDDRAVLTVEHAARYALGDPAAPLLVLNAADAWGCLWAADVPDGWESPEVTLPMDRKPSGHGGYAGEPTYEPRTLTIEGLVTAPTAADLAAAGRRWLAAILGSVPTPVRYTHLDEGPARGLWVYPSGRPKWRALDDRVAEFSCVLVADDPIKTGLTATYGPVRLPAAGGDGGYPMGASGAVMPWTASGSTVGLTVAFVPNVGDEDSHAIYTVTGPVPRPRIQLGTGEYVALAADLAVSDTWVVDTAAGTSRVNGVNRYDAWVYGSTFPLIPGSDPVTGAVGGTEVRLRSGSGGTSQIAGLTVTTAPSWK